MLVEYDALDNFHVYNVSLYSFDVKVHETFKRFSVFKSFQLQMSRLLPDVHFMAPFPRTYKRNVFGIKLGLKELESRRYYLREVHHNIIVL